MKITIKTLLIVLALLFATFLVKAQTLYVGTNYHPHDDKDPEKIQKDITLMKAAGFKAVRMGHLCPTALWPGKLTKIIFYT